MKILILDKEFKEYENLKNLNRTRVIYL